MPDPTSPQESEPQGKPPYLFLIPVAVGLVGFIGYQTVRMGTDTHGVIARSPYAIDTSVAQAVVDHGVITVHARAATQPRVARVQIASRTSPSPATSATPQPSPSPSASAGAKASPSPKPVASKAPPKIALSHQIERHARPRDEAIAQQPVPHIRPIAARAVADVEIARDQPAAATEATTPPITDAPSVRTAPVEAPKAVVVAEAPKPEPPAVVNAADRVVDARMTYAASPDYPEIARDQGVRGTSVVFVTVGPQGAIVHMSIASSSGNAGLDRSAMSAARQSRYAPPKVDGKPATETYRVTYDFAP